MEAAAYIELEQQTNALLLINQIRTRTASGTERLK